jgi:hypothetical protein
MARLKDRIGSFGYFGEAGERAARTGLKVPETGFFGREFDVQDFQRMVSGATGAYELGKEAYKDIVKPVYKFLTQGPAAKAGELQRAVTEAGGKAATPSAQTPQAAPAASPAAKTMSEAARKMLPQAPAPSAQATPSPQMAASKPSTGMTDEQRRKILESSELYAELGRSIPGSVAELGTEVIEGIRPGPGTVEEEIARESAVGAAIPVINDYNTVLDLIGNAENLLRVSLDAGDLYGAKRATERLENLNKHYERLTGEKRVAMGAAEAAQAAEREFDIDSQIESRKLAAQAMSEAALRPMGARPAIAQLGQPGGAPPSATPVTPLQARASSAPSAMPALSRQQPAQQVGVAPPAVSGQRAQEIMAQRAARVAPQPPAMETPAPQAAQPVGDGLILGRVSPQEFAAIKNALMVENPQLSDSDANALAMRVALEQKESTPSPQSARYQMLLDRPDILSKTNLVMSDIKILAQNAREDQLPAIRDLVIKAVDKQVGPLEDKGEATEKALEEVYALIPGRDLREGIKFKMGELSGVRRTQAETRKILAEAETKELKNLRRKARKVFSGRDRALLQFLVAEFGETGQARWRVDPGLISALDSYLDSDYVKGLKIPGVSTPNELIREAQRVADKSNKNRARMNIIEKENARQVRREIAEAKAMRVSAKEMKSVNAELTKLNSKKSEARGELNAAEEALKSAKKIKDNEKQRKAMTDAKQDKLKAQAKLEGIQKSITSVETQKNKIIRGAQSIPETPVPVSGTQPSTTPSYKIIPSGPPE